MNLEHDCERYKVNGECVICRLRRLAAMREPGGLPNSLPAASEAGPEAGPGGGALWGGAGTTDEKDGNAGREDR